MARRSARLQSKTWSAAEPKDAEYDSVGTKVVKRRRITKEASGGPKRRRVQGKLKELFNLPLDVLFEIFGHLHPYDLLRLSRASKEFRKVLLSKNSRHVWRNSLTNIEDFPSCPTFLNEPTLVNLLFDGSCYFCGTHTPSVEWEWLKRCCRQCAKNEIIPLYERVDHYMGVVILRVLEKQGKFNPNIEDSTEEDMYYELSLRLMEVLPPFAPLLEEFEAVSSSGDEDKLEEWVAQKLEYAEEVNYFRYQCQRWQQQEADNRSREKTKLRAARAQAIEERLISLGWKDEFDKMTPARRHLFEENAFVKQPKLLTDRVWENHEQEAVNLMQVIRSVRLRFQREQFLVRVGGFLEALEEHQFGSPVIPAFGDIYLFPEFHSWFRHDPLWTRTRVLMNDIFDAIETLDTNIEQWTEEKEKELLALLRVEDSDTSSLQLATTLFKCHRCEEPISFPRILVHRHIIEHDTPLHGPEWDPTTVENCGTDQDWFDEVGMVPWGCSQGRIQVYEKATNAAKAIVEACGMDSTVQTKDGMDEADPYLVCTHEDCHKGKERPAMSWSRAILHVLHDHDGVSPSWQLLSEQKKKQVIKKQSSRKHDFPAYSLPKCGMYLPQAWSDILDHLIYDHRLTRSPKLGEDYDYFIDLEMDSAAPKAVLIQM